VFTTTEQFITQMKFRELQMQRDKSLAAYEALRQELATTQDDRARLQILYRGLRGLQFAKQPLHPDVANLELILRDLDADRTSSETVAFWRAELERELARGRLRSEIVYVFGALLEEWAAEGPRDKDAEDAQREIESSLLGRLSDTGEAHDHSAFLQSLFAGLRLPTRDALAKSAHQAVEHKVYMAVKYSPQYSNGDSELEAILQRIKDDPYRSSAIRSQAQRFLLNPTLLKELADALTILIDHIEDWDWPSDGVSARAVWARSKWRLFLDEDLPTACLLELLGTRWNDALEEIWGGSRTDRIQRLQRLLELGAPAIIIENERLLAGRFIPSDLYSTTDIWADSAVTSVEPGADASLEELSRYWGEPGSIYAQRAAKQGQLHSFDRFDRYMDDSGGGMDTALSLVNAEIQLGRAAFPDRPLYVIKMDIRDFYPSLPHGVILSILERFGLAERDLAFFRRYLQVRISRDGHDTEAITARTGIPNHRRLSNLLGEAVLLLLDQYVQQRARVQIIRLVDDICFIAVSPEEAVKAWDAVRAFCAGCGLAVNDEKCGAVCIGGELPPALPSLRPNWQLLALDEHGQWSVEERAFEAFLEQTRQQLASAPSIIARVRTYNDSLAYLEQSLAYTIALGQTHRNSVYSAAHRFHGSLFGDEEGITQALVRDTLARFPAADSATRVPEAWLYWPITAGGLGLRQATLRAASYVEGFERRKRVAAPAERAADWQRRENEWSRFYTSLLEEVKQIEPAPNKVMETLVSDFISRGADLSHGKQKTLSAYWRWILYVYGPQILDAFGTFRFLFSELVPLQLIIAHRSGDGEATDIGSEADSELF
jgi:hypothetical protein